MNVVLIEDNEGDVFLFEELLTDIDYKIKSLKVIRDGELAFKYLSDHKNSNHDLVFLDINLPKLNGHEILAKLSEDLYIRKIPVVILTSSSNAKDMSLLERSCVVKYIVKPIEPLQLTNVLNFYSEK